MTATHLEMDYSTISDVIESWEELRRIPDYDIVAGTTLFGHLFEECPKAKLLFGFPLDMDPSCDTLRKSRRFTTHAKYMIEMLDRSIGLLGPDAELLAEILIELGKKHVALGVPVDTFPIMGDALIQTLREKLGDSFTVSRERSWNEVYRALSSEMITHMNDKNKISLLVNGVHQVK